MSVYPDPYSNFAKWQSVVHDDLRSTDPSYFGRALAEMVRVLSSSRLWVLDSSQGIWLMIFSLMKKVERGHAPAELYKIDEMLAEAQKREDFFTQKQIANLKQFRTRYTAKRYKKHRSDSKEKRSDRSSANRYSSPEYVPSKKKRKRKTERHSTPPHLEQHKSITHSPQKQQIELDEELPEESIFSDSDDALEQAASGELKEESIFSDEEKEVIIVADSPASWRGGSATNLNSSGGTTASGATWPGDGLGVEGTTAKRRRLNTSDPSPSVAPSGFVSQFLNEKNEVFNKMVLQQLSSIELTVKELHSFNSSLLLKLSDVDSRVSILSEQVLRVQSLISAQNATVAEIAQEGSFAYRTVQERPSEQLYESPIVELNSPPSSPIGSLPSSPEPERVRHSSRSRSTTKKRVVATRASSPFYARRSKRDSVRYRV